MTTAKKIERKILFNSPAESDSFSGGGHQRTADALARTIQQFNKDDRAIGLEGKWGAGKTTIVRLAEKALADSDKSRHYHVFEFDLWANQTAHFRRAFLESLLSRAKDKFRKHDEFIIEKQDIIRDRVIETDTKYLKKFSIFGLFVLAFLLLLPAIYTWLNPFALLNPASKDAVPIWTWAALAAVGAMFVGTLFVARDINEKQRKGRKDYLGALSQSISPFSKEAEKTTITPKLRRRSVSSSHGTPPASVGALHFFEASPGSRFRRCETSVQLVR